MKLQKKVPKKKLNRKTEQKKKTPSPSLCFLDFHKNYKKDRGADWLHIKSLSAKQNRAKQSGKSVIVRSVTPSVCLSLCFCFRLRGIQTPLEALSLSLFFLLPFIPLCLTQPPRLSRSLSVFSLRVRLWDGTFPRIAGIISSEYTVALAKA